MTQKIILCDLVIHEHSRAAPRAEPATSAIDVLYSDDNVRIMKMFDASLPPNGREVVRVDIYRGQP